MTAVREPHVDSVVVDRPKSEMPCRRCAGDGSAVFRSGKRCGAGPRVCVDAPAHTNEAARAQVGLDRRSAGVHAQLGVGMYGWLSGLRCGTHGLTVAGAGAQRGKSVSTCGQVPQPQTWGGVASTSRGRHNCGAVERHAAGPRRVNGVLRVDAAVVRCSATPGARIGCERPRSYGAVARAQLRRARKTCRQMWAGTRRVACGRRSCAAEAASVDAGRIRGPPTGLAADVCPAALLRACPRRRCVRARGSAACVPTAPLRACPRRRCMRASCVAARVRAEGISRSGRRRSPRWPGRRGR